MSFNALHSGCAAGSPIALAVFVAAWLATPTPIAHAATIEWKGHTWQLTSGGMAGSCQGDPKNVTLDSNDYLHLKISHDSGTWSAAELFTTDRLGFGTYQWQVDGPIDTFDPNVVLGFYPYGPQAGIGSDGTNEIDIEYSRWGFATGANGDWTDYPASGSTKGELSYTFSLNGSTLSTSRFVWSKSSITDFLFSGLVDVSTTTGAMKTWTYQPQNSTTNIPQQALPLGMNLWCYDAPPSDGTPVEVVIRDFVFVAENSGTGGAGTGGAAANGGGSSAGSAGRGGAGGAATNGGGSSAGSAGRGGAGGVNNGGSQSGGAASNTGGASSSSVGGVTHANGGSSLGSTASSPTGGTTASAVGGASAQTGGFTQQAAGQSAGGNLGTAGIASSAGATGTALASAGGSSGGTLGAGGTLGVGGTAVNVSATTMGAAPSSSSSPNSANASAGCGCRFAGRDSQGSRAFALIAAAACMLRLRRRAMASSKR